MSASGSPAPRDPAPSARLRLMASREHALQALVELSHRLWRSDDIYSVGEMLLLNLMGQVGTTRAVLWIKSEGPVSIPVLIRSHGVVPADAAALMASCWTPLARHFADDPRPLVPESLPTALRQVVQPLMGRAKLALFAPLRAGNEVLGLVALGARAGSRRFEAFELEVLGASLAIAAAAVRNARLYGSALESQRRLRIANEALEELDRLKSEFISNVNHELRTPLSIVMGCLSCLGDDRLTAESRRELVGSASLSSQKLLQLIESLLTFSTAARGELVLDMSESDLSQFLAEYHQGRRPGVAAGLRQLHLSVSAARRRVRFDPARLQTLLDELVDNALRFTPQGSNIWIEMRDHVEDGRAWTRVDVRDDGPGIPSDQVAGLFDTFRQRDGSTTRKIGGMGMGLPLARKLAEAMGGLLSGSSEPGLGSVFSLDLPVP